MQKTLILRHETRGFTLIELMIVIAILGILFSIAFPQLMKYRARGYNTAALSDVRAIRTNLEAYYSEWDQYPSN